MDATTARTKTYECNRLMMETIVFPCIKEATKKGKFSTGIPCWHKKTCETIVACLSYLGYNAYVLVDEKAPALYNNSVEVYWK